RADALDAGSIALNREQIVRDGVETIPK
ncbi:hypothetical protein TNCV_4968661, partial [Trichonephila clavipes]